MVILLHLYLARFRSHTCSYGGLAPDRTLHPSDGAHEGGLAATARSGGDRLGLGVAPAMAGADVAESAWTALTVASRCEDREAAVWLYKLWCSKLAVIVHGSLCHTFFVRLEVPWILFCVRQGGSGPTPDRV